MSGVATGASGVATGASGLVTGANGPPEAIGHSCEAIAVPG